MTKTIQNSEIGKFRAFLSVIRDSDSFTFLQWIKNKDHHAGGGSAGVVWFQGDDMPDIEDKAGCDLYFGVNATSKTLKNEWGKPAPANEPDIATMRCLYGDFDDKALDDIVNLQYPPHVIIESSKGSYHGYFILKRPLAITDKNRDSVKAMLEAYIGLVGADPKAKDLRRILRVAGTYNYKKENADENGNPFMVRFIKCDLNSDNFYSYVDLQSVARQYAKRQQNIEKRRDSFLPPRQSNPMGHADSISHNSIERMYQTCIDRIATAGNGSRNAELNKITYWLARWSARGLLDESDIRRDVFGAAARNGYLNEHGENDTYRVIESAIQAGKQNAITDLEIERMKGHDNSLDWQSHRDLDLSKVPDNIDNIETNAITLKPTLDFTLRVLQGLEVVDAPVPCIIPPIADLLPYHQIGELTAIGGGTSTGKTQICYSMIKELVRNYDEDTYLYGPEWDRVAWSERDLIRYGGLSQFVIDANKVYHADIARGLSEKDARGQRISKNRLEMALKLVYQQTALEKGQVFKPRDYSMSFEQVLEDIRNVVYKQRSKGRIMRTVFIDYAQALPAPFGQEYAFYESVSWALQQLAIQLRLAIFVFSQLNQTTETALRDNRPAITHNLLYLSGRQYKTVLTIQLKYIKKNDLPIPYYDDEKQCSEGKIWITKSTKSKAMISTEWLPLHLEKLEWGF